MMKAARMVFGAPLSPGGGGDRGEVGVGVGPNAADPPDCTSLNALGLMKQAANPSFNVVFYADRPLSPLPSPTRGEGNANCGA
jgi:hypothetical protein